MHSGERILVLAPHTDDGELGCGGSLAASKATILYLAMSYLPEFQNGILRKECEKSAKVFGAKTDCMTFPVRNYGEYRQDILDKLIVVNRQFEPDLVLTPSVYDIHQDHQTVTGEAVRAFKNTTLLGYETPWNNYEFVPNYYIRLSDEDMEKKLQALSCYESQQERPYFDPEFIRSWARLRGMQAGSKYAEAFHAMRIIQ